MLRLKRFCKELKTPAHGPDMSAFDMRMYEFASAPKHASVTADPLKQPRCYQLLRGDEKLETPGQLLDECV